MDTVHSTTTSSISFQTVFAIGVGLVITGVYLTRRRKHHHDRNTNSPEEKSSASDGHVTPISSKGGEKIDSDLEDCRHNINSLEKQIEFEKERRCEAEKWCSLMEKELQMHLKAKKVVELKYEKLLKRYDVISGKLKSSEERCKKLVDALNCLDSDGENYSNDLIDDYDDDDDEVHEGEVIVKSDMKPLLLNGLAERSPEFELEKNVMEALVATAVMDIDEIPHEYDHDSLTDLLLTNMSEEDLEEHIADEDSLNKEVDALAEEELSSESLRRVTTNKQFWENFSQSVEHCSTHDLSSHSSEYNDLERSSPFLDLKRQWDSHMSGDSGDDDVITQDGGLPQADDGRFGASVKVGQLKLQWEEKMTMKSEDNWS